MKKILYSGLFLFISLYSVSQTSMRNHKDYFQVSAGRSFHGTGDLRGLMFSTEYGKYFRKKLSWSVNLTGSIHDGSEPLEFTANGQQVDGSIRYSVAGIQAGGHFGYSIFKNSDHELLVKAGGFLRYQSSSLPDQYEIAYPAATGLPYPVIIFRHSNPQRTYTVGWSTQLQYNYSISRRIFIGLLAGIQNDSEGDVLSQIALSAGLRF